MGFLSVRNYRNIFGISSNRDENINFTGLYAEIGNIYLCVPQTGVQSTFSMLILRGLGVCPQQKIFEN